LLGKKVSQKRQFFSTNPPQIFSKNNIPFSLYLNNVRVQGEKPIKTGKYIIKVNGYSNYSFEIIDPPKVMDPIEESNYLLNFNNLEYTLDNDGDMSGLLVNYKPFFESDNLTIKNWINTNLGIKKKSNNIILKAINQSKNGKNK